MNVFPSVCPLSALQLQNMNKVAALVLAAGRGTRMKSTTTHKVMSQLHGKPMLYFTITRLRRAGLDPIIIVVGFAKESIKKEFDETSYRVIYADQDEPEGTAHAVQCGLQKVPLEVHDILSVYGDDSYLYDPELLRQLIRKHQETNADVTLLTVEKENPTGLGRIIRDESGTVTGIIEEKVATEEQKMITEVNTGCFIFDKEFITEHIGKIEKNSVSQEYYLTDIIEVARKYNKKIEAVAGGKIPWQGVNTPEELEEARKLSNSI